MAQILVIDDDELQRDTLRNLLQREGYEVAIACNGKEALNYLARNPTTLVITDIYMPEMDGFELIDGIHSKYDGLKVIAISGGGVLHAKEITHRLAGDLGLDGYFEKPFVVNEFLEKVKELVPSQ